MKKVPALAIKPLALMIPALLPAISAADPIVSAAGNYSVSSNAGPQSGGFTQSATANPFSQYAGSIPSPFFDDNRSAVAASSDGTGHFAASVENHASFSNPQIASNIHLVYTNTIVNSSTVAQNVAFDFSIAQLQFAFELGTASLFEANNAQFSASILSNNISVWSSSFSAESNKDYSNEINLFDITSTGTDIGLGAAAAATAGICQSFSNCDFSISGYNQSLNLGFLAPSASLTISYVVDLVTESTTYGGSSSIYFNDPAGFDSTPNNGWLHFASASHSIPEPASVELMGVGLVLLGAAATRRRKVR